MRYLILCCLLGACTSLNGPDKSDELTFRHVLNHFVYIDQSKQKDVLKVSYEILNNNQFYGDCDDFVLTLGLVFSKQGVKDSALQVAWHDTPSVPHLVLVKDGFVYSNRLLFPQSVAEYSSLISPAKLVYIGTWKEVSSLQGQDFVDAAIQLNKLLEIAKGLVIY